MVFVDVSEARRLLNKLLIFGALIVPFGSTFAQSKATQGIKIEVQGESLVLFQIAVPPAISLNGEADTRGLTESLTGTIRRDLKIAGYFNLISPDAYLSDPTKEGMKPRYKNWFNIGTQGLIKVGFAREGSRVRLDMRLYSIDGSKRVKLPPPYDETIEMPVDAAKIRLHTHGFVDEVINYYTKSPGFFRTRIIAVKRVNRGKELVMVSPDGLDETRITRSGGINMLPSLGKGRIYFTSFRDGGAHMFVKNGAKVRSFSARKGLNTGAAISPDGKYVAVTLSKDGNPEIYLLHPDTGEIIRRVTKNWAIDTSPAWSPDGKTLAFVSDRHGSPQIWVTNLESGQARRLTFQGDYNQTPDWSPRGDLIAFTARDERAVFDLFTVNVIDGSITRLTQNQGNNEEPSWSPDGRYLVFTSTRNGRSKLYISTPDGRIQNQISTGKGSYMTPNWER
ncbi:MAG: hypothetical protein VX589_15565 [Myxococcota bacterium]|nr:hypothetical protein [Myxococcota bacterium]